MILSKQRYDTDYRIVGANIAYTKIWDGINKKIMNL
jgi:hypothetical protein